MASNTSYAAQLSIKTLMQAALDSPVGIKIEFTSEGEALKLRARFNHMRSDDRKMNKKIYPAEHPMHGGSVWDSIETKLVKRADDKVFLYFMTSDSFIKTLKITDIATDEPVEITHD